MSMVESPIGNQSAPRGQGVSRQAGSVFMVAGEASGDWAGARLAEALRRQQPNLALCGIGGRRMAQAGVELIVDSSNWAAIGVFESLSKAPAVLGALRIARAHLQSARPSALVLIDCGAVNLRIARLARDLGLPALYYFPPGSWRKNSRRVTIRDQVDMIATPFPWSKELLSGGRALVEWVGHPVVECARPLLSREAAGDRYGVDLTRPVVAIAPGSRGQEIHYLLPVLVAAARKLQDAFPEAQFLVPVAASLERGRVAGPMTQAGIHAIYLDGMEYDALQLADVGMVCSGSVTLEFACLGIPMVVTYRASRATTMQYWLVRGLIGGQRFAAMPNIIAGREVVRELMGSAARPEGIAEEVAALLRDERQRARIRAELEVVVSALGPPGASERTAEMVFALMRSKGAA